MWDVSVWSVWWLHLGISQICWFSLSLGTCTTVIPHQGGHFGKWNVNRSAPSLLVGSFKGQGMLISVLFLLLPQAHPWKKGTNLESGRRMIWSDTPSWLLTLRSLLFQPTVIWGLLLWPKLVYPLWYCYYCKSNNNNII